MSTSSVNKIFENIKWNISTIFKTLQIHRDKRVWIFGSWMGSRFADNSRFLFQYLSKYKEKYGIDDVIWISRNQDVVSMVNKLGYKAFHTDSKEGIYYHYKAGVHVICNSNIRDIDTRRSFGAIKIQLWHGNGIKASGKLTRKKGSSLKEKIWDSVIKPKLIPGRWFYAHWIACSEESKRVLVSDSGALPRKIVIANSPRLCPCLLYLPDEVRVIDQIKKQKATGKKTVLFLPTFRGNDSEYVAPLDIPGFIDFIETKNILWIQKNHSADNRDSIKSIDNENIISLDSSFDVNVLYDFIDIFISDYSSATTDAIYKNIVTIDYCPDFELFSKKDRGFVSDYTNYHIGNFVVKPDKLSNMIESCFNKTVDDYPRHKEVREFLFDSNVADYDVIVQAILRSI